MRKLVSALAVLALVYFGAQYFASSQVSAPAPGRDAIASAFTDHRSSVEVTGQGVVARVLADDRDGSPHQRFILTLPSGQTVLIAHNIALAERIPSLKKGDVVQFKGEYEWNRQGGVIHWTHRDPQGRHEAGWLRHAGRTYH